MLVIVEQDRDEGEIRTMYAVKDRREARKVMRKLLREDYEPDALEWTKFLREGQIICGDDSQTYFILRETDPLPV